MPSYDVKTVWLQARLLAAVSWDSQDGLDAALRRWFGPAPEPAVALAS